MWCTTGTSIRVHYMMLLDLSGSKPVETRVIKITNKSVCNRNVRKYTKCYKNPIPPTSSFPSNKVYSMLIICHMQWTWSDQWVSLIKRPIVTRVSSVHGAHLSTWAETGYFSVQLATFLVFYCQTSKTTQVWKDKQPYEVTCPEICSVKLHYKSAKWQVFINDSVFFAGDGASMKRALWFPFLQWFPKSFSMIVDTNICYMAQTVLWSSLNRQELWGKGNPTHAHAQIPMHPPCIWHARHLLHLYCVQLCMLYACYSITIHDVNMPANLVMIKL